jgi:hypothetical protein
MSQQDDQNRDKQQQGGDSSDQRTREGRGDSPDPKRADRAIPPRPDQGSDVEDTDEMDEDRDEDWRPEGGANRRFNIG